MWPLTVAAPLAGWGTTGKLFDPLGSVYLICKMVVHTQIQQITPDLEMLLSCLCAALCPISLLRRRFESSRGETQPQDCPLCTRQDHDWLLLWVLPTPGPRKQRGFCGHRLALRANGAGVSLPSTEEVYSRFKE